MVEGLADGTIDVIVSSHDPHDVESKRLPFDLAASGVIGLETILPIMLELHHGGHVELSRLLAALTSRPAEISTTPTAAAPTAAASWRTHVSRPPAWST